MLFDLRSRGRRRSVQAVYLGLAVLMGGGLILFGVGTGTGGGGLLNGLTGSGSSNQQGQVINQQVKKAQRQTEENPNSPAAWGALVSARWENASSSGYDSSTNTYTADGKKDLAGVASAWQRYLKLTNKPTGNLAILAANTYGTLGQYANQASAWEIASAADPGSVKGVECLAISAYAAKQTRKGDLAAAKALTMVPKASRKQLQSEITAAKTDPSLAQSC